MVFVIGSPRSGTTFLGKAIGSLPGFVDLGEVVTTTVSELADLDPTAAARRLRRTLDLSRRVGLAASVRAVEQTPEMAFLAQSIPLAYPSGRIVHIVRDGRDVVCSLLEKGWLSEQRSGRRFGSYARFWVEPSRVNEFPQVSEARRAAWAWRRYVTAAMSADVALTELRYEDMASRPALVAEALAGALDAPPGPIAKALSRAHSSSVGRYRRDLTPDQLADVEAEAGDLLRDLGYA